MLWHYSLLNWGELASFWNKISPPTPIAQKCIRGSNLTDSVCRVLVVRCSSNCDAETVNKSTSISAGTWWEWWLQKKADRKRSDGICERKETNYFWLLALWQVELNLPQHFGFYFPWKCTGRTYLELKYSLTYRSVCVQIIIHFS